MKVRTNLQPHEQEAVGKGLQALAKGQRKKEKPYVPENQAEREILRQMDSALDTMLESLQAEFADILID